jgi:3-deoxy-D-manno-octulosonate 8-phosphate phosphatase (KDO 8-P phosphatase)
MPNKEVLQQITTFMLDIDGVLTDGSVIASENGDQLRVMNIKDAFALQLAIRKKYRICVISGGSAAGVQKRLENLGIKDIYMKIPHKLPVFHKYLLEHKLVRSEILYIGDDLPDYEIMQEVGVSAAPADAASADKKDVKKHKGHKHAKKDKAAEDKMVKREDLISARAKEHDIAIEKMRKDLQNSVNATTLEAERIRAKAVKEGKDERNEANMLSRLNSAALLQANVDKAIEAERSKPGYDALLRRSKMPITADTKSMVEGAIKELEIKERAFDKMRQDAQDTVDFVRGKAGMNPSTAKPADGADKNKKRPDLNDPSLQK